MKSSNDASPAQRRARLTTALLLIPGLFGCAELSRVVGSTWHDKCGWKAADYFDDPQVIALCHAIEADDLAEIDRLVATGADVNAQGKGKMTPLLWAYPDNKLERFKRLLEHGADPNVIIESDFNTRGGMSAGDSVTHMACKTAFPGYFEAVFEHGGDVNLINAGRGKLNETPLFMSIIHGGAGRKDRVQFLIDHGADLNHIAAGATPSMQAVSRGGQYDIALMLLKAGADYRLYQPNEIQRLIHIVAREDRLASFSLQQRADYGKLVQWLEDRGESLKQAKADIERWDSWSGTDFRRKMDAEIAERKAREAQEQAAEKDASDTDAAEKASLQDRAR